MQTRIDTSCLWCTYIYTRLNAKNCYWNLIKISSYHYNRKVIMVLDCKKILKLYQFWNLLGLRVLPCAATLLYERNSKSYYDIATIEKQWLGCNSSCAFVFRCICHILLIIIVFAYSVFISIFLFTFLFCDWLSKFSNTWDEMLFQEDTRE